MATTISSLSRTSSVRSRPSPVDAPVTEIRASVNGTSYTGIELTHSLNQTLGDIVLFTRETQTVNKLELDAYYMYVAAVERR